MLNLSTLIEDSAFRYPDKTAVIFGDHKFTYEQINKKANQVANLLIQKGIQPGDKVALSCMNIPWFPIIYFGILKAGAVVVPLSILLKKNEIAYHLKDSDAKIYFCFEGVEILPMGKEGTAGFEQVPECQEFILIPAGASSSFPDTQRVDQLCQGLPTTFPTAQTSAEDTAVIIYTSGTTGRPKGAELTHSNLMLNAIVCDGLVEYQDDDVQLITLPLYHIYAQSVQMNAGFYHGVTCVLLPRFTPQDVLQTMKKEKVTVFCGVPTMYWAILNYDGITQDLIDVLAKQMRICLSGGAALPVQVLKDFKAKFNTPILEGYGMSEGSPVVTFNSLKREQKAGSVGFPVWGVEVAIFDENDQPLPAGEKGQLVYRGHNVMKGYYKRPEVNKEVLKGGWLHSGDVAIMDEDGYFYIVDRTKDMIIRGGVNVYPREIEEMIIQHEAVSLVAVIGLPHEAYGEEIMAVVVLNEGASLSEEALIAWSKERMAAYKYPRVVDFVDALPLGATGKILKRELRSKYI